MATRSRVHIPLRIAWAAMIALIVGGSLLPGSSPALAYVADVPDKFLHFGGYLVLGLLPALHERWRTIALSALGAVGLGVLLEYGQAWMNEGRNFEVLDMVSNAAGCAVGVLVGRIAGARLGLTAQPSSPGSATGTKTQSFDTAATSRRTAQPH